MFGGQEICKRIHFSVRFCCNDDLQLEKSSIFQHSLSFTLNCYLEILRKSEKNFEKKILFTEEKSEFNYEDWKSWTPEQWIEWSNSKEYKEKYLNPLNAYKVDKEEFPFKTYEDLDGPVLDYR